MGPRDEALMLQDLNEVVDNGTVVIERGLLNDSEREMVVDLVLDRILPSQSVSTEVTAPTFITEITTGESEAEVVTSRGGR